jgi:superfamily II DNA or RNA helicase
MNTPEDDPLPHQVEAVYGYVMKLPRTRFLMVDDRGAGKTIMAGLIIKDLKVRHMAERILVVALANLKDQRRRELTERFEENFAVVDLGVMDALYCAKIWAREQQIITSVSFAKQVDPITSLPANHVDLVVVDGAHKMAAYGYGAELDKTSRYRLDGALPEPSTHCCSSRPRRTAATRRTFACSWRLGAGLLRHSRDAGRVDRQPGLPAFHPAR